MEGQAGVPPGALGRLGEELAARHLERGGWTILHRNVREGRKEIDLIARRGSVLAFVEVKTRRGTGYGHPLDAIDSAKRREIREVASRWLARHRPGAATVRFDAVAVMIGPGSALSIEHREDAWGLE